MGMIHARHPWELTSDHGCRGGSKARRIAKAVEQKPKQDQALPDQDSLKALKEVASSVKSRPPYSRDRLVDYEAIIEC